MVLKGPQPKGLQNLEKRLGEAPSIIHFLQKWKGKGHRTLTLLMNRSLCRWHNLLYRTWKVASLQLGVIRKVFERTTLLSKSLHFWGGRVVKETGSSEYKAKSYRHVIYKRFLLYFSREEGCLCKQVSTRTLPLTERGFRRHDRWCWRGFKHC